MKSALHETALKYAARGIPVFPCIAGTKVPATEHGFHEATCDVSIIDMWWATDPEYNVAFSPLDAGVGVVDLDGGQLGKDEWAGLELEHGLLGPTFTVATPRGGVHIYVKGELPPTQKILAPHIDTRGRGSYVLVPPSRTADGVYTVLDASPIRDCPDWLPPACASRHDVARAAVHELDLPGNIARATKLLTDYVKRDHVAVELEGGDNRTFITACEVVNLGLSEDKAHELLCALWNPACRPPWDEDQLREKVENAARYAQNEQGAWAVAPAAVVFGSALDKLIAESITDEPERPNRSRFYPLSEEEQDNLPPPSWLLDGFLPADSVALLYGPPASYKSFVALDIALAVASGIKTFGATAEPGDVVYLAGEGPRSISQKRRPAWKLARDVDRAIPFHLIEGVPWLAKIEEVQEVVAQIKERGLNPKLVVIDTLARGMPGLNENDAKDAGWAIEMLDKLRRDLGCTVLVVHHGGKDEGRGARGSSAIPAGVDAAFEIKTSKDAKAVAVWCRKQKDADEPDRPWCFEGRELAGSLVFYPITGQEYHMLTHATDAMSHKAVSQLLVSLNAIGADNFVTTHVLAEALVPADEHETAEDRQDTLNRAARALRARAKDTLGAYCELRGRDLMWGIPAFEKPD